MISLKGCHFPRDVVLYAVYFYLRYTVAYRDLEEIMAERGVRVDHATLNRWVTKYSPLIPARAQSKKRPTLKSWRVDETYIRVRGNWMYLYRAEGKAGNTLDFMLSERRNGPAWPLRTCPVELWHGTRDTRSPYEMSVALKNAFGKSYSALSSKRGTPFDACPRRILNSRLINATSAEVAFHVRRE